MGIQIKIIIKTTLFCYFFPYLELLNTFSWFVTLSFFPYCHNSAGHVLVLGTQYNSLEYLLAIINF